MAPWARLLAQVLFTAGNVFIRAFTQALQQAQHRLVFFTILCCSNVSHHVVTESATGNAKQAANKIMGKMDPGQARKILNIEKPYTAEQITQVLHFETSWNFSFCFLCYFLQQFENIFKYNDPKVGGSYYLQCKSEHAKNALHEELAQEYEREMNQNSNDNDNNNQSSTKSDL